MKTNDNDTHTGKNILGASKYSWLISMWKHLNGFWTNQDLLLYKKLEWCTFFDNIYYWVS